jgi:hypothetical protein
VSPAVPALTSLSLMLEIWSSTAGLWALGASALIASTLLI